MNKVLAYIFAICFVSGIAQEQDTLRPEDVIIVQEYEPTITNAFKISNLPTIQDSSVPAPNIKYSNFVKQKSTSFEIEPIKPAKMRGEPLNNLSRAYLKAGAGNYTNTLLKAEVNTARSRKHALGARIDHFASQGQLKDLGTTKFSDNSVEIYGKKFLREHLVSGQLDYNRNGLYYYGYDATLPAITIVGYNEKQVFNKMNANTSIQSFYKDSTQINHLVKLNYYNLSDRFKASENNLLLDASFSKFMGKELLKLNATIDYNNFKTQATGYENTQNSAIIKLDPKIVSRGDKWRLDAGLRIGVEPTVAKAVRFFPNVLFRYNVYENYIIPYAGVTGDIQRNSLNTISNENPYILSSALTLANKVEKLNIYGGVRGAFSSTISFNLSGSKGFYENYLMYNKQDVLAFPFNSFYTIYDGMNLLKLSAEISYAKTDKLNMIFRADYFDYDTQNELVAWNLPYYKLTYTGVYDLKNKILIRADLFAISDRKAHTYDTTKDFVAEYNGVSYYSETLPVLIDVNIGAEYRYNKKLSAFVNINNIAGMKYYRWRGYPSQGINILGGLTYSFWEK